MRAAWTTEKVRALAPDGRSARAGLALADGPKWSEQAQGHDGSVTFLWAQCQGSAKTPYEIIIELEGPASRCSCPSRKTPCKLGALLPHVFSNCSCSFPVF